MYINKMLDEPNKNNMVENQNQALRQKPRAQEK